MAHLAVGRPRTLGSGYVHPPLARAAPLSACVLLLLCCSAVAVLTAPDGAGSFTELTLHLEAPATPILPSEAVPLLIEVRNDTRRSVLGHDLVVPISGILDLYLAQGEQPFRPVHLSTESIRDVEAQLRLLPPGHRQARGTYVWWGRVEGGPRLAFLTVPGEYRVKAVLSNFGVEESIESNVVTIRVVEPGPRDASAWEFLRTWTEENQSFFFRTASLPGRRAEELEAFIAQFPDSRYTAYARHTLGREYRHANRLTAAAATFEKVLAEAGFPLREEVLYFLVSLYTRQGRSERADERLAVLEREFPESRFTSYARHHLQWRRRVEEESK